MGNWGWKFTKGNSSDFQNIGDTLLKLLRIRGLQAMEKVIQQAVEDTKKFTANSQSGASKQERTSDLINSIAGKTFLESADVIVGEFGFLNRKDLYFALQTSTGFTHLGGEYIQPSFALVDAERAAVQNLVDFLNEPIG